MCSREEPGVLQLGNHVEREWRLDLREEAEGRGRSFGQYLYGLVPETILDGDC